MGTPPFLKVDHETPDKPEVLAVAIRLGVSPGVAFTACFRVWCWAQKHTKDGTSDLDPVAFLDAYVKLPGFARALAAVGWLNIRAAGGFVIPRFDRHISLLASKRALGRARAEGGRKKNDPDVLPLPACLDTTAFRRAWGEWAKYRTQRRSTLTESTIDRQLKRMAQLGERRAILCIEASIENGWIGLFPERLYDGTPGLERPGRVESGPNKYGKVAIIHGGAGKAQPRASVPPPADDRPGPGPDLFGAEPDDQGPD